MKTYTILVSGINWDLYDEESDALMEAEELPSNGVFEIKTCANPNEELFCDTVVEALTKEYGFCIDSIDDIEVLNEVTGIGKQI